MFLKWNYLTRQDGFTLVELILSIVLISILSFIAIPRLISPDPEAFKFSQELRSSLRYVQQAAVASNCPVHIVFTVDHYTAQYAMTCTSGVKFVNNPANQRPWNGSKADQGLAPKGITLPDKTIKFNGLGVPDKELDIDIAGYKVKVEAETGYVH